MSEFLARFPIGLAGERVTTGLTSAVVNSSLLLAVVILEGVVHVHDASKRLHPAR